MSTPTPTVDGALAHLVREQLKEELETFRSAVRADLRKALAELRLADGSPEVSGFDVRGAAAYVGVSPRTIARLKAGGRLPHVKVGRQVRFRREDLDKLLATE